MSRSNRLDLSWAILPATMELWGKRKIAIEECASVWPDGTILVCENEAGRTCFISSAGWTTSYDDQIGTSHRCHHDQTMADKGYYTIRNVVKYRLVGQGVELDSVLPYDRSTKASLAVFK